MIKYNDLVVSPDGAKAQRYRLGTDTQYWFDWENVKHLFQIVSFIPMKPETEIQLKNMDAFYFDKKNDKIYISEKGFVPIMFENRIDLTDGLIRWLVFDVLVSVTRRVAAVLGYRKNPRDFKF